MCARAEKARPRAAVPAILRLNKVWALFLKGKKLLKGSALLLSWQHCASPFNKISAVRRNLR